MRRFESIAQPKPAAYAGIPFEPWPEEGVDVRVVAPHNTLFIGEAEYWAEKIAQARTAHNTQLIRQGHQMHKMLAGLSRQRPERIVEDLDEFTAATALVGLSRYLRGEEDPHKLDTNDPASSIPKIMLSFDFAEAARAGVHMPRESLEYRDLPVPEDTDPRYFESKDLFIQLTPANFSAYEQSVAMNHGVMLDPHQYASIIPRIKWDVWTRDPRHL
jgi:hypothetical protein